MGIFFRPGQQLKTFEIFRKTATTSARGRVFYAAEPELIDAVHGTIARASQHEQNQWNQNGHQISHTIVIRGRTKADAGDEVRIGDRVFSVQGKHDPAELGFFSTLYCLERLGVSPAPQEPEEPQEPDVEEGGGEDEIE